MLALDLSYTSLKFVLNLLNMNEEIEKEKV